MEIWIEYQGDRKNNYTRYGKEIPKNEKKIDVQKYFGLKEDKREIENRIKELEKDKNIKIIRHRS